MKAVVQRVSTARVDVGEGRVAKIDRGLLILLGVEKADTEEEAMFLAKKIAEVRIFPDDDGKMNLDVRQVQGEALVVSQFTLCADLSRGRRPGYDKAMPPQDADRLYLRFTDLLAGHGVPAQTGRFGADMKVSLVNDGPVTFCFERSKRGGA